MSQPDDLHKALLSSQQDGRKVYRRKRTHKGEAWKEQNPPTLQEVHRGVWCSACKKRHPYNGAGKVLVHYEKQGGRWALSWLCPVTNNFLKTIHLGGNNAASAE